MKLRISSQFSRILYETDDMSGSVSFAWGWCESWKVAKGYLPCSYLPQCYICVSLINFPGKGWLLNRHVRFGGHRQLFINLGCQNDLLSTVFWNSLLVCPSGNGSFILTTSANVWREFTSISYSHRELVINERIRFLSTDLEM